MSAGPDAGEQTIDAALLRAWPLPDPGDSASKEDRGRVLVVGGSRQLAGAPLLAGVAALRAGAGKLQVATVASVAPGLAMALPEARVLPQPEDAQGALAGFDPQLPALAGRTDAVLAGPGLERSDAVRRVVRRLLACARGVAVLDAGTLDRGVLDDISALRGGDHGRSVRGGEAREESARDAGPALVLTPHHGEMAALLGADIAHVDADPAGVARDFAARHDVVLALKARTTWIAAPDGRLWVNRDGSAGLGTSGSGDVLAGIVAGLAARGATPEQAAVWGVHLHARAGARLAARMGQVGFLAREIAGEVPALLEALARGGPCPGDGGRGVAVCPLARE